MHHDYDMSWKEIIGRANQDFALGVNQVRVVPSGTSNRSQLILFDAVADHDAWHSI